MSFREKKATEAAAFLLKKRGGRMPYLKLIKLLYMADRESLVRWGYAMTTDDHVSMKHGPVVSNTYDLIRGRHSDGLWAKYISRENFDVLLTSKTCPTDELSRAEEKLLTEIADKYGLMDRWKIRDHTHTFGEWSDPGDSSLPISIEDILTAQGVPPEEIRSILREMEIAETTENILEGIV